jgi:broad specificity phosphatase PhoE
MCNKCWVSLSTILSVASLILVLTLTLDIRLDAKSERSEFGRFYYRFPSGEAGLDVYNRVSSFISTLVRDCNRYHNAGNELDNLNVVIVTHG